MRDRNKEKEQRGKLTEEGKALFVRPNENWGTDQGQYSFVYAPIDKSRAHYLNTFAKASRVDGQSNVVHSWSIGETPFTDWREWQSETEQNAGVGQAPINFAPPNGGGQ